MKKFTIEIMDSVVYINGHLHTFECKMDKEDNECDMDKKAILALADEMEYEPVGLFEEMADRLNEMLDEEDF
jgi:hypothetical protein